MNAERSHPGPGPARSRWLPRRMVCVGVALGTLAGATAALGEPPRTLHETGLYRASAPTEVRPENLAFSPQYALWSDGASKRRWVHVPRGKRIQVQADGDWRFPIGTRFWKEFRFGRKVETRFLEKERDGSWSFATYVWNQAETEALLAPPRGLPRHHPLRDGLAHSVPGISDCRACHETGGEPVLGFSALQLSPDRDPLAAHAETPTPDMIDLRTLAARGLIRGLPARALERPPVVPARSAVERAALGYLHVNCGGCHNPRGPLASLGLDLQVRPGHRVAAALTTAVGHPSRFQLPHRSGEERIRAGQPEASVLVGRLRSRHPVLQMPPLGTVLVDEAAVALLERWIADELPAAEPVSARR